MFKKPVQPINLPNGQDEKVLIGMNLKQAKELILQHNPTFEVEITPEMYQYSNDHYNPKFVRIFYKSLNFSYKPDSESVVSRVERE